MSTSGRDKETHATRGTPALLRRLLAAQTTRDIEDVLKALPIVDEAEYSWSEQDPELGWKLDKLHWIPIGRDRGNAGRIQLAGDPYNPIAERLVNSMEALIELARRLELLESPDAPMPASAREAVERYFGLPRLDLLPRTEDKEVRRALAERLREVRQRIQLRLAYDSKLREFSVEVRDEGIGQGPKRIHETLLSLGRTDKADKPYLIGVFGQGGSSTYFSSRYSVLLSRRHSRVLDGAVDGIGWSIVRKISPKGRRDPFYAYLADDPAGHVPSIELTNETGALVPPGTTFRHIGYDFGRQGSAIARTPYYALNHVLFNPVLPYDLYALKDKPDPMHGNGYRLALQTVRFRAKGETVLDESFQPQPVGDRS